MTADDVKYAIERSLLPGVPNGYVQTYLSGVEGIDKAIKEAQDNPTGGAPDISGITAPDDTTLEIKLNDTTSIGVIGALTLPVSSPVPEEYAKQFDAENPSTYGEHQVATGPYMIENDCVDDTARWSTRSATASSPATRRTRRSTWFATRTGRRSEARTDFRPAYLDEITIQEGFADTVSASKKILAGSAMVNGDFTTPPSAIKQAATEGEEGQLTLTPSGGNRYVALNTQSAAVRRHQRPQGRDRELEPHRPAEHPWWRADRTGRDPLPAAGVPRVRGGRRARGPGPRLHREPRWAIPQLAAEYMKKAGF